MAPTKEDRDSMYNTFLRKDQPSSPAKDAKDEPETTTDATATSAEPFILGINNSTNQVETLNKFMKAATKARRDGASEPSFFTPLGRFEHNANDRHKGTYLVQVKFNSDGEYSCTEVKKDSNGKWSYVEVKNKRRRV